MERPEMPLEPIHENIHHHAKRAPSEKRWIMGVALSSAVIAALAAIVSPPSGSSTR